MDTAIVLVVRHRELGLGVLVLRRGSSDGAHRESHELDESTAGIWMDQVHVERGVRPDWTGDASVACEGVVQPQGGGLSGGSPPSMRAVAGRDGPHRRPQGWTERCPAGRC
jgi:hypothetical protein